MLIKNNDISKIDMNFEIDPYSILVVVVVVDTEI